MDLIAPRAGVQPLQRPVAGVHAPRRSPPAKVSRGVGGEPSFVDGSLLCQGSIVSGAHVERSIIGPSVFIDHDAHVTESIIFPGVHVGAGARLHRCIIDKNVDDPAIGRPRSASTPHDDGGKFTDKERQPSDRRRVEKGRRPPTLDTRMGQVPARPATTGAKASMSSPPTMT